MAQSIQARHQHVHCLNVWFRCIYLFCYSSIFYLSLSLTLLCCVSYTSLVSISWVIFCFLLHRFFPCAFFTFLVLFWCFRCFLMDKLASAEYLSSGHTQTLTGSFLFSFLLYLLLFLLLFFTFSFSSFFIAFSYITGFLH